MQVGFGSWIRRGTWSAATLTGLVLVAGLAASLGVGSVLRDGAERAAARAMNGRTELTGAAVDTEVRRYLDQIRTIAAALSSGDQLNARSFARITAPLAPLGLSGATSVALAVPARTDQLAGVQAQWRRNGVTGLKLRPWGSGSHRFVVLSTRLDGQPPVTGGLDLARAPVSWEAMDEALRTDGVAVSDTYEFLIDQHLPASQRQHSFVLVAPVYEAGQRFRGWVLMGLRGQDFIKAALSRVTQNLIDVQLLARNANGSQTTVATLKADVPGKRDLHRQVTIPVAQRKWTIRTAAAHAVLPGGGRTLASALTATLLGLTALLAILVGTLASGRSRAERLVTAATGELRRTEREARDQAQLLGTILDSITDGVGVVDQTGTFLMHNPAGRALLGVDEDVNATDDWQEHYGIYHPDGERPFPVEELPLIRALHGEAPTGVELLIRNRNQPDGRLISVNARQLALADGTFGAVAVFRDVTDDRAHEAELAGFAGVVAHDLKSPLTTVVGYSELLSDLVATETKGLIRADALSHLARIQATAARMRALIDDLLAYTTARDASVNLTTFSLDDLVREVVAGRVLGRESPDVAVGPLAPVEADPVLIRQVLENLIGNALKYTPPGRPARVEITAAAVPGRPLVRVEVADQGIGLPAGEHTRVFARFHRAHPDAGYAGTGLGLAICQRIVERHGGTIGATDNPGGGTCFWFTLPAARLEPQAAGLSSGLSSSA